MPAEDDDLHPGIIAAIVIIIVLLLVTVGVVGFWYFKIRPNVKTNG